MVDYTMNFISETHYILVDYTMNFISKTWEEIVAFGVFNNYWIERLYFMAKILLDKS